MARPLILDMIVYRAWAPDCRAGRREAALGAAGRALDIAIRAGLGHALGPAGEPLFDPVEVEQFLDWSVEIGLDPLWRDGKALANAAILKDAGVRDLGEGAGSPDGRRYRVSLRRTFDLRARPAGVMVRLRLPLPLRCPYHRDVRVRPVVAPGVGAEITEAEGRLEVRLRPPVDRLVSIGAEIELMTLVPDGRGERLDAREAEIHLRPREGLIQVTSRLRALARELAGSLLVTQAVAAFWTFLAKALRIGYVRHDEVSATPGDWALDNRRADCLICAATLVALCRAHGIPARLVSGYYLHRLAPSNHTWAEIWIDGGGWTPFDMLTREPNDPDSRRTPEWRTGFARRRDFRLVIERLPRQFTGPTGVRFPAAWQMLYAPTPGGVAITHLDIADGSLIYRDEITVAPMDIED